MFYEVLTKVCLDEGSIPSISTTPKKDVFAFGLLYSLSRENNFDSDEYKVGMSSNLITTPLWHEL